MSLGWVVLLICLLSGGALFFSVNAAALRIFSLAKLQDALKAANRENLADNLVENAEKLILTCSLYRLIANCCILLLLLDIFAATHEGGPQLSDYLLTFIIAATIFSIFSLAIPHAWAKYAGEKVLSQTYKLLMLSATIAWPILYIFQLYDGFVRRMAGVAQISPEEQQEEKQEEFLTDLEQHRMEGVVDKEEQEMIESVLELDETSADEIMTPRT
ncbi:MAG TPA: CNNM domain-containing protein, partial [Sedimentisphaerales bacterium]|nr:CNNM domain-containing protein [Sedimentisphaerales bacterium]